MQKAVTDRPSSGAAGSKTVLWHNLREEPVLYINGKPYVVRESNKPFANLEYTGGQQSCCAGSTSALQLADSLYTACRH